MLQIGSLIFILSFLSLYKKNSIKSSIFSVAQSFCLSGLINIHIKILTDGETHHQKIASGLDCIECNH